MFVGCPLCNGITFPGPCLDCGTMLEDLGMVEDFFGPYSPYQDSELIEYQHKKSNINNLTCIHLVYCPQCRYYDHLYVPI